MKIDWNNAPKGATHWGPETEDYRGAWYKRSEGDWFFSDKYTDWEWAREFSLDQYRIQEMVPRTSEWSGEGLPPVGTVCEYRWGGVCKQVEIIAHWMAPADLVAVYVPLEDGAHSTECGRAIANAFRPLRTPEQIAAEEREKAILEMVRFMGAARFAQPDTGIPPSEMARAYADALHDAGYRKTEGGAA